MLLALEFQALPVICALNWRRIAESFPSVPTIAYANVSNVASHNIIVCFATLLQTIQEASRNQTSNPSYLRTCKILSLDDYRRVTTLLWDPITNVQQQLVASDYMQLLHLRAKFSQS